ncbi:MAG: elongation factor 4 [Candidatus Zambryskibacteria bacterium]|nr:elongation factor 4 [Candidatus Zambryskibacteria bacterium]
MENIRNFCIIAHIDHGKSTLADRMLEITHTVEARKMKDQALDDMELERERGITIKMTPVRMIWTPNHSEFTNSKQYILNLIDTPGHIDFSYEVSRALSAVDGALLLVDATQGIQAQTITVLQMAREQGLVIIPVLSKVDSPLARVEEVKKEIASLINCQEEEILETSGKTGSGVKELLQKIVEKIPAPASKERLLELEHVKDALCQPLQVLVFDFEYSTHRGVIVYVMVKQGEVKQQEKLMFKSSKEKFTSLEVGFFRPNEEKTERLRAGEIGYIVTGIKTPGIVLIGDTIGKQGEATPVLLGYSAPKPVVWASIFPEDQSDLVQLRQSLAKLKLTDSSLFYEEESSGVLGKGFRCGFLGMLHLEIITERLKREFDLNLVITQPSITYEIEYKNSSTGSTGSQRASSGQVSKKEKIYSPVFFPNDGEIKEIREPWVNVNIITPTQYVGTILPLLFEYEAEMENSENLSNRTNLHITMPLRELMRGFFDRLKSISQGYASLSYEEAGERKAEVTKITILINGEEELSLARVVSRRMALKEAENIVEKLSKLLPRQMFEIKIQAEVYGRIVSSRTLKAYRKDVTQHMYGGDITRKMKLREKQKKGKKKMKEKGKMFIPQDVFVKIMKPD